MQMQQQGQMQGVSGSYPGAPQWGSAPYPQQPFYQQPPLYQQPLTDAVNNSAGPSKF